MSGYDKAKRYAVVAEARRKWTDAEKKTILADADERSVSAAARQHGVAASLVFRWRRQSLDEPQPCRHPFKEDTPTESFRLH